MSYNVIDTRDLAQELEDLEDNDSRHEDEEDRYKKLVKLQDEIGDLLSNDEPCLVEEGDSLTEYCRDFAEDVGYLSNMKNNPLANCIDWEKWADLVRQDYSEVEFDGTTYLRRSC